MKDCCRAGLGARQQPQTAQKNISIFTAQPQELHKLLQHWDKLHQELYRDKEAAKRYRDKESAKEAATGDKGAALFETTRIAQWPESAEGSLRDQYISKLGKVTSCLGCTSPELCH